MIPLSVIQDDDDHTMHYSQSLPYAELLDNEAEKWLDDVCSNLVISVQAKDFMGGALAWTKRLVNYMDMKHAIPRETRAKLAKLLYELVVMPGMDPALIDLWANTCVRLIRHKKRLSPQDIQLEWRPLYAIIEKTLFPKNRQRVLLSQSRMLSCIIRLAGYAQRFFEPSAAEEILQEFLPQFNANSVSNAIKAQAYLVLLLPTEYQSQHSIHPQEYLSTIFSLWSMFTNSIVYNTQFVSLVSDIAEYNLGQGNEISVFTKQQVKSVFTTGLTMMNLPVGSRSDGGGSGSGAAGGSSTGYTNGVDTRCGNAIALRKKSDMFKSLAKFIVYTIVPDQENPEKSYTLSLFSDLIQATELYFHPSNHGAWSYRLTAFARHLASEFLKRWREEQEEDCETPQHHRLTPEFRKEFVLILRPVVYLSMFGKDQYTVGASQSTLKYLSWLEPSLIFPGLLERIYPSLETLTETHRTSSALSILSDIALPLFSRDHYPAGGKHLVPLLQLAIPGIDMNDPIKTIASLMFISTALMVVPICDQSQQQDDYYPTEEFIDDPNATLSRETEDYLLKATTGDFEGWLAKFLRRVFTIFENLPQESRNVKKGGNTLETGLTQMLLHTCDIVFGQLSEELYDLALRMVVEFVTDRVLPNAVRPVGLLCDAIASIHPKKAAKVFLPLCIANIHAELEHGAASTVSHAASSNLIQSDSTFHWYQNILFSVISNLGPELLNYKEDVVSVTHAMLQQCRSRRGIMWTGKLIRGILHTLLNIYPKEFKSMAPSEWNDKDFMSKKAHQVWGRAGDPANLEIQWHTPSEAEKDFALSFLNEFLNPSMKRLEEMISQEHSVQSSHEISNEFCRHLAVVRNCLIGSSTMVADDGIDASPKNDVSMAEADSEVIEEDDDVEPVPQQELEVGYAFTDPNDPRTEKARTIRRSVGEMIHRLSEYFRVKREDDVESVKVLVKIARTYLSERGIEKSQFDRSKNGYSYAKNIGKTPLCKKRYPRNLLIRRAYNHHLLRLRQNNQSRLRTPMHDTILLDLLEMSLGSYAEIRKVSQNALSATARCFRGSKKLIIPVLLDALQPDVPADRMKGALYLFMHKSIIMPCLRDWTFIPSFVRSICYGQHQDKLTIQDLIRKVFSDYISYVSPSPFKVVPFKDIGQYITALSPSTAADPNFEKRVSKAEKSVSDHYVKKTTAYQELIDLLLEVMNDTSIHWRYSVMAGSFLDIFLRSEMTITPQLAAFATKASVSELPRMRSVGLASTTQLLLYIKEHTFAAGNIDLLIARSTRNPLKVTVKVEDPNDFDMGRRLLDSSYTKLTPENIDSSLLVDHTAIGWYVWPSQYDAYKVNSNDFMLQQVASDCREAYDEFLKIYSTPEYWEKLCSYYSEEVNNKEDDRFVTSQGRFFDSIFQTFGDRPLVAAKAAIEKLCEATDQKNSQRAAAVILGGLIRGTKHWSLAKTTSLWEWLTPLLRNALDNITPDSLSYWESFVRFCVYHRDPRRIQPLIDLLLEPKLNPASDAAFAEYRKLSLVRQLICTLEWRFEPLKDTILPSYLENIQHPYKQVREIIGTNINELLQLEWIPSFPSVQRLLEANAATDGVGNVPTSLTERQAERVADIITRLDAWFKEMKDNNITNGSSDYSHASKTVLCWLYEAFSKWGVAGTLPYILPLLPKIFTMQEVNDDQDLQMMASRVLKMIAKVDYPPSMLPSVIDTFLDTLTTSSSWHIRIRALPVLQILFFKHLFAMESSQFLLIMEVIGKLLLDSQIEVRQLASVTLGGLVRCSQRDAIQTLLTQFAAMAQVTLPKRKRDKVTGKNVEPAGFAEAVLQKHAGVLGISCLVNAFPYEVPEWMPTVLCQLADCMSDPAAEIQATIRKTFSDFRRTHSDTWHEDMLKFDEDQLSVLSDMLISPSYYA